MPNYHPGAAGSKAALSERTSGSEPAKKAWRVIHACEYARDVLAVIETQVSAGMRPFIVTPSGAGSAELYLSGKQQETPEPLSLLRSWQDVRNWRKSILECNPEYAADVVHAHSFAAGMAAVRNCSCVVYDVHGFIEELAIATSQCEPGSWMARSFRVAEQFILTRAGAVIVHSKPAADAAHERGAARENIFVIPACIDHQDDASPSWPPHLLRDGNGTAGLTFLIADLSLQSDGGLNAESRALLQAFNAAAAQVPAATLLLVAATAVQERAIVELCELFKAGRVRFENSIADALIAADVVITAPGKSPSPADTCVSGSISLRAMSEGKTLIAADCTQNREITPEGRGCLWYEPGNADQLAAKMVFVAENPAFRSALGRSAVVFLQETRSPAVLGRLYEEAYRHASIRRRTGASGPNAMQQLLPAPQAG